MKGTDFSNSKDIIVVRARFKLLDTVDRPRKAIYRPNHVFEYVGDTLRTYVGEIQFDGEEIQPGEEQVVTVYFMDTPTTRPWIHVGRKWWIHEGTKLAGLGEIISVI